MTTQSTQAHGLDVPLNLFSAGAISILHVNFVDCTVARCETFYWLRQEFRWMVDPFDVTNFKRSREQLEEYWLFCLSVAGKKATMIASKLSEFMSGAASGETPFAYIRRLEADGNLASRLAEVRMGKYGLLAKAYAASAAPGAPDLATASVDELETIPGVGPKTARYFVLHSRRGARVAAIDTHVLKYLKARGHAVPKGVPTGNTYRRLEKIMLDEMDASGMGRAEFDLALWSHYASNGATPLPPRRDVPIEVPVYG